MKDQLLKALNACGLYTREQRLQAIAETARERNHELDQVRKRHQRELDEATKSAKSLIRKRFDVNLHEWDSSYHDCVKIGVVLRMDPFLLFDDERHREMVAEEAAYRVRRKIMETEVVRAR